MRQIINLIKWAIILAVIFGLAFLTYAFTKINKPFKTSASEKVFTVAVGSTTKQVAESLEKEGLISRAIFFRLYSRLEGSGQKIQAGNYFLSPAMSISQIAKKLTQGEVVNNQVKFTVIEGWTMDDIGDALEDAGLASKKDFLRAAPSALSKDFDFLKEIPRGYQALEGYLFPDTYLIAKDSPPIEISRKMVVNFDKKVTADLRQKIKAQGQTIREIIILASIVEKEVGRNVKKGTKLSPQETQKLKEERRKVASVFYNRLKAGIPMNSDATISYITGRKGSSQATLEETKISSPYNTYKYRGLPPGPISNPSLDAILAAVEPAKTDYLYFVTAPDGTAYFARTLQEHMANRETYLK